MVESIILIEEEGKKTWNRYKSKTCRNWEKNETDFKIIVICWWRQQPIWVTLFSSVIFLFFTRSFSFIEDINKLFLKCLFDSMPIDFILAACVFLSLSFPPCLSRLSYSYTWNIDIGRFDWNLLYHLHK